MNILIGCEFSGIVREAFARRGHNVWSCDLLPTEIPGQHIQYDITLLDINRFDMLIAFPPCTHLSSSGARWFKNKIYEQDEAIGFVLYLAHLPIKRIVIENPIGVLSTRWRKPDQIIQPWWFGDGFTKATCLWLKNLPPLMATKQVPGRYPAVHLEPPGPDRGKNRSRTYPGFAEAMAAQWGSLT